MKLHIKHVLNNFIVTHVICIIFFMSIYYHFFNNANYHWVLNSNIPLEEYKRNKLINSLFLSVNLQTTTGYMDFNARSPIARLVCILQLFLSFSISIGAVYIYISNN